MQARIGFGEVALVGKAARARNLDKRKLAVAQQSVCLVDPALDQPLVRRQAGRLPKRASEMPGRQRAFPREIPSGNISLKICTYQLFRAPFLPCGETASPWRNQASHASIRLRDMKAESETDVIREELGDPVGFVECRQKQLRNFLHDAIHDAEARSKIQIGEPWRVCIVRDRVQSLPRQEIVHGIKWVDKIEPRGSAEIVEHDAARM